MRKMAVLLVLVACGSDAVVATVPDAGVDAAPPAVVDSGSDGTIADANKDAVVEDATGVDAAPSPTAYGETCVGSCADETCAGNCAPLDGGVAAVVCWHDDTQGPVNMKDRCTFRCTGGDDVPTKQCAALGGGCAGTPSQVICLKQ